MKWALGWIPVVFALTGAAALLFAASKLIRESRLAVRGTLTELDYVRKLVARKTTMPLRTRTSPKPVGEMVDAHAPRCSP